MRGRLQALYDRLVANDPTLTKVSVYHSDISTSFNDENDARAFFQALQQHTTVEHLRVDVMTLSSRPILCLASALKNHPSLERVSFVCVKNFSEAIALAIQSNDELTGVELEDCELTPALNEKLKWLLMENCIQSLTVENNPDEENPSQLDLSGALRSNRSLKELHLLRCSVTTKTLREVALMLKGNPHMQTLELDSIFISSDKLSLILEAAESHESLIKLALSSTELDDYVAESLGGVIAHSPSLEELEMNECIMKKMGFRRLMEGLNKNENSPLKRLTLANMMLGDVEASVIGEMLELNKSLNKLDLRYNRIGKAGACGIAKGLRSNRALEYLIMRENNVGPEGTVAIAESLHVSTSLKRLNINRNQIMDTGVVAIARMLTINSTLEDVDVGPFRESSLDAFITNLPNMRGIKKVRLWNVTGFTSVIADRLVEALKQNVYLENLDFVVARVDDEQSWIQWERIKSKVDYLLALNQGGRRILTSPSIPRSYWSRVLGRSSSGPDAIFFFLREKAGDIFERGTAGTKRKRNEA